MARLARFRVKARTGKGGCVEMVTVEIDRGTGAVYARPLHSRRVYVSTLALVVRSMVEKEARAAALASRPAKRGRLASRGMLRRAVV